MVSPQDHESYLKVCAHNNLVLVSFSDKRKGRTALFLFVSGLILTLISSTIFSHVLLFLALTFFVITIYLCRFHRFNVSHIACAAAFFIFNVLISIFIYSPVYSPTALYYISFFICCFILFSQLELGFVIKIFKVVVIIYLILASWALLQYFTGLLYIHGNVPNSIFTTRNTFAAALNLVLIPLCIIHCFKKGIKYCYPAVLVLFSALVVTQSRGGYISFLVGFIALSFFVFNKSGLLDFKKWLKIIVSFLIITTIFIFSGKISSVVEKGGISAPVKAENVLSVESSYDDRLYYYKIALNQIRDNPLIGYGFLNYKYYFHRDKPEAFYGQERYGGFVHNDYLQLWVETGLLGIISILLIIIIFYKQCYSLLFKSSQNEEQQLMIIGIGSALTAYFTHALVDFVMYPPILLLFFGACLGIISRLSTDSLIDLDISKTSYVGIRPKLIKVLVCVLSVIWLSQPAIAEVLKNEAIKQTNLKQYDKALNIYNLAINFAPYNAEFNYQAGRLLYTSVELSGNKDHANMADVLFEQGAEKNPFDYHNLFARILLHREYSGLLNDPVSKSELLEWFKYILVWQPQHHFIISEYIKTLIFFNEHERAVKELNSALKYYPDSSNLLTMKNSLSHIESE